VRAYDAIDVEAIQAANLCRRPASVLDEHGGSLPNGASRKAGRNTSMQDAGWGHFLAIRACTAAGAGTRGEAVSPAYTTQDCSGCGAHSQKSLRVRTQVCTDCGLVLDRDEHAARARPGVSGDRSAPDDVIASARREWVPTPALKTGRRRRGCPPCRRG
jgi:putative transposase